MMVGRIAIQQALRELGFSYRQIADLTGVHPRTVWQHCNRSIRQGGSGILWEERSYAERDAAVQEALKVAVAYNLIPKGR